MTQRGEHGPGGLGMTRPTFTPPKWRKPAPLGYANAIDSVGSVASPLLAGFSLTTVVLISGTTPQNYLASATASRCLPQISTPPVIAVRVEHTELIDSKVRP
jgi:hypothetical protein